MPSVDCKQLSAYLGAMQLASLGLRDGQNTIDFMFGRQRLRAYIYFLHWHTRCVCGSVQPHLMAQGQRALYDRHLCLHRFGWFSLGLTQSLT